VTTGVTTGGGMVGGSRRSPQPRRAADRSGEVVVDTLLVPAVRKAMLEAAR
jgi:hypothetical protein